MFIRSRQGRCNAIDCDPLALPANFVTFIGSDALHQKPAFFEYTGCLQLLQQAARRSQRDTLVTSPLPILNAVEARGNAWREVPDKPRGHRSRGNA